VVDPLSSKPEPNASEPKPVVPNLDAAAFDESLRAKAPPGTLAPPSQPATKSPPEPR